MLKNHVIEGTGINCYALFSQAAVEALNLFELAYPLIAHLKTYEHLGEVSMQVLDLHKVWEREQKKKRILDPPESAWLALEWDLPYPPSIVWEYLTIFRLEMKFAGYDSVERTDSLGGRTQAETTYHCAHGETQFFNTILDWKPFEYYTIYQRIEGITEYMQSRVLTPTEKGTQLAFYNARPPTNATQEIWEFLRSGTLDYVDKFQQLIEADIASGKIIFN